MKSGERRVKSLKRTIDLQDRDMGKKQHLDILRLVCLAVLILLLSTAFIGAVQGADDDDDDESETSKVTEVDSENDIDIEIAREYADSSEFVNEVDITVSETE